MSKTKSAPIPNLSTEDRWKLFYIAVFKGLSTIGTALISISAIWFTVQQDGGNTLLGATFAGISIFMMLTQPYYGTLVDSVNRKHLVLWVTAVCVGICLLTLWSIGTPYQPIGMIISVIFPMIYFNFTTPCMNSIKQEIFPDNQQRKVTSYFESILNGTTAFSSILAIFIIPYLEFTDTLYVHIVLGTLAGLTFTRLQYISTLQKPTNKQSPVTRFISGLNYIWGRKFFLVHTLVATAPFLVMGTIIFLNPVFLNQVLQAESDSLAITRACIGVGSFLSGLFLHRLLGDIATHKKTYITALGMIAAIFLRTYSDDLISFYITILCVGMFNAGCRECRMNLMHDYIENEYTGRVYTSIQSSLMIMRAGLISIATAMLVVLGPENALMITWYITIPTLFFTAIGMTMTPPPTLMNTTDLGSIKENAHGTNTMQG